VAGPVVRRVFTARRDGDLAVGSDPAELAERRTRIVPGQWTWLQQVHGIEVAVVTQVGEHAGAPADAVITAVPNAVLAVHTADCAPVLLADEAAGVVGVAHAGWVGLESGVVQATVAAMVRLGAAPDRLCVDIGAHIGPRAYEFGRADLTRLALRYGPDLVAATLEGRPALDLGAGVIAALGEVGVAPTAVRASVECTATATTETGDPRYFSWRARRDTGRQASLIWLAGS